jgi:beta-galactosidase
MTQMTQHRFDDVRPFIGAQVFIEPGQTPKEIDTWFRILADSHMPVCRIRLFETYMRTSAGGWDFTLFDLAFRAAEKHGIQILGTLFPATPFTDVGGFKFPHSQAHLEEIAIDIERVVTHYRSSPALMGWVLINEPGLGGWPDDELSAEKFELWKAGQPPETYRSRGYPYLEFERERFLLDYNTWYLTWLAGEIEKHDPGRHLHVNTHAIFQLVAEYNFPQWRPLLTSLGGSAHASWHFGYFRRDQYVLAMAADCEIIRSGAGGLPWLMTEIQGGNNVYSGLDPLCPTREEITQWLWTIIGTGGQGGIFWCLNPRASGFEAGEWALIDFLDQPSDRLGAAAAVGQILHENQELFVQARPVAAPIHILYIRESLWVERRLQRGGTPYEGRDVGGVMKSALGYFETLSEMGIPCGLGEIGEFDFSRSDYSGVTLILAHQVSLPSRYWPQLENFVGGGGKLIVDGLTAYYDEHAHCIMKTGFPLAELFGARVREFKLIGDLFPLNLDTLDLALPAHCWRGTLQCTGATPVGFAGDQVIAARHSYGLGEVLWLPSLIGLGGRLGGDESLSRLLAHEVRQSLPALPFRFAQHRPGLLLRSLDCEGSYITVLINKGKKHVQVSLILSDQISKNLQPEILFSDRGGTISRINQFHLPPEETLVVRWSRGEGYLPDEGSRFR